jgi:hypothetical protein
MAYSGFHGGQSALPCRTQVPHGECLQVNIWLRWFFIKSYLQESESNNSPLPKNKLSPGEDHNPADSYRTQILHGQQLNSVNTAAHISLGVHSDSQYHDYSWRPPTIYGDSCCRCSPRALQHQTGFLQTQPSPVDNKVLVLSILSEFYNFMHLTV